MFTITAYLAILTSKHHSDIIQAFEELADAITQARAWVATSPRCTETVVPGYALYLQYGTRQDTVRVQSCRVALAEPGDDDAVPLDLDPEADATPTHLVTRQEWQALQRARARGIPAPGEEN